MSKIINNFNDKYIEFITSYKFDNKCINNMNPEFRNQMILKSLNLILQKLNQKCGAETIVNYRIKPVISFSKFKNGVKKYSFIIQFPVQQHNITSNEDLVLKDINIITTFIENFDWTKQHKQYIWLWRNLLQLNYKPNSYIKFEDYKKKITWGVPDEVINKYQIKIRETSVYKNGSINNINNISDTTNHKEKICTLKEIVDPLIQDYGLYINLSVPFSDMNYGYNYLHYYEHMMTYAWKKITNEHVLELNGGTTCNALCYLYNIHENIDSLHLFLEEYINFHLKSRDKKFWNEELMNGLKTELERTTSETLLEKSMTQMAKRDPVSIDKYNSEVLVYYSNKPFEIITYTPIVTNTKEIINKYMGNLEESELNSTKPEEIFFDYYPIHVGRDKALRNYLILSSSKVINDDIKMDISNNKQQSKPKETKGVPGVDNFIKSTEDLSELNTILMQILLTNGINLKKVLSEHPTPISNLNLNYSSTKSNDITGFFLNMKEI